MARISNQGLPIVVQHKEVRAGLASNHGADLLQGKLDRSVTSKQDGPPLLLGLVGSELSRQDGAERKRWSRLDEMRATHDGAHSCPGSPSDTTPEGLSQA
jgi:hypothetical protein